MGVTRIVRVVNEDLDNLRIDFRNYEKTDEPLNSGTITGGAAHTANMAVPWCVNEGDYKGGHWIYVRVERASGPIAFQIWQAWWDDGDFVRIRSFPPSSSGWPPFGFAAPMRGESHVDGDRILTFREDGPVLLLA